MKLYYPGPEAQVRIEMESGHVANVGREPRELPEFMHRAAMKLGCLPEGVGKPLDFEEPAAKPSNAALRALLIKIADAAELGTVDEEGRPLPEVVNERLGYTVVPKVLYALWAEIEQDLIDEPEPAPAPPTPELSDAQVTLISELSQASFRGLKERLRDVSDVTVVREVLAAEHRKAEPRPTVIELLTKLVASVDVD